MTSRSLVRITILAVFVFVLVLAAWNSAGAADFYKGKTVRMVVSSSPAAVTTPTRATSPDTFTDIFRALRG